MTDLEAARARLESAVGRLESAAGGMPGRPAAAAGDTEKLSTELAALRDERQRLLRELDTIRADYRRLREVTATVSSRLDHAIGDLKAMRGG